jgi:hypothetical protein
MFHAEHHAAHQRRHRRVEAIGFEALDAASLRGPPALLNRQSIRPNLSIESPISARIWSSTVTSVWRKTQAVPSFWPAPRLPARGGRRSRFSRLRRRNAPRCAADAACRAGYHRDLAVQPSMSFPHLSDAGFSITPACRNNASRAGMDWAMAVFGRKTRVFRYVRPYFGFADQLM